jgi:hypothetical protein
VSLGDVTAREIELEALKTEREGMIAGNKTRELAGDQVAYGDDAFFALSDKIRALKT